MQVNQETGRLAVVNAGSNTIQMYNIDPKNPTKLTPIGSAVPSGGDFPESIAINNAGDQLCVLNGGLESNVQYVTCDDGAYAIANFAQMLPCRLVRRSYPDFFWRRQGLQPDGQPADGTSRHGVSGHLHA